MKKICVFDTSVNDDNLGNKIIMQSVYAQLDEIFPKDFFLSVELEHIAYEAANKIKQSDVAILGGTNSLNSNMDEYHQWGINRFNIHFMKNKVILLGVGWWKYQGEINNYTKKVLRTVLSQDYIHSVRDSYTKEKLNAIGIKNVVNTGCPTIWNLSNDICETIPIKKGKSAIISFTSYNQDRDRDRKFFDVVKRAYENIYCWVQSPEDYEYALSFDPYIYIIEPSLSALEAFLRKKDVDYVGTRLHAGIKCLQYGKRSLIIGIDNRAIEMYKDFHLPVLSVEKLNDLENIINRDYKTEILVPTDAINLWKKQFLNKTNGYNKEDSLKDKLIIKIYRHLSEWI